MHADAKSNHKHSQRNTSVTHKNNFNVSEINYQTTTSVHCIHYGDCA